MTQVNGIHQQTNISNVDDASKKSSAVSMQGQNEQMFSYKTGEKGKGTEIATTTDFNIYGKNYENFDKFKGNDKHDSMRLTNQAANDVKVAYMQLQHDFPDVVLQFEPMPDPKTCGKKREGFITYQQLLEDWKDNALLQINNARSIGTRQEIRGAAGAVIENDNANAAMNAAVTTATGQAVIDEVNANTDEKAKEINANVDREGAATRKAVHNEGAATRSAVYNEGAATREVVYNEGAKTRYTVRQTGKETQELESLSGKLSDVLMNSTDKMHTNQTIKRVESIRDKILSSDISHEEKKELLNNLANWADQLVLSDREILKKMQEVQKRLE